jgi:hypothetical protein
VVLIFNGKPKQKQFLTTKQIKMTTITQYFSKWQNKWVYFTDTFGNTYLPSKSEIAELQKHHYQLK